MRLGDRGTLKNLESVFIRAARLERRGVLGKVARLEGLAANGLRSALRRWVLRRRGRVAPVAIALSPTMRCNLDCAGCYASDYPRDDELPLETIDDVLSQAERLGVFLVIVTGGEPLVRDGIIDVLASHRRLVFLLVTNGTLLDRGRAEAIAGSRNIVPVVSLEGPMRITDGRRGGGTYDAVVAAMRLLNDHGALFGFSATVTAENWSALVADEFVGDMIGRGCALGFYTEYIPIGTSARPEWVLGEGERRRFREGVLAIRRTRPIIAVHLPDDEYDKSGKCLGVTGGCVHINAQGYVEPCPFAHYGAGSVRRRPLAEILESRFLTELRSSEAVVRRGHIGCALVENRALLDEIANRTGVVPTDRPHAAGPA